ncbi:hypothetical protein [Chitinophaga alhagiae]|uniref:hypothetical protein n=1 Tax=Chitinophaga alhagiae TaxID=2203219 RepID=UPI000E5B070B|nr:hypothetical protein [Chitinophaga alhagiae]
MTKHVLLFFCIIAFSAFSIIVSCNKQQPAPPEATIDLQSKFDKFKDVKIWTESMLSEIEAFAGSVPELKLEDRRLLWDQLIKYKEGNDSIFQIPIKSKTARFYTARTPGQERKMPDNGRDDLGYSYLVVTKYGNGRMDFAVMTIQGNDEFIRRSGNNLSGYNYRNVKSDFSGFVLFHTWTGLFLNGWQYSNGRVTGKITAPSGSSAGRRLECTTVTLDWYCQVCKDWYTNGTYTHTQCGDWYYCGPAAEMFFCVDFEEPGDPSSGGSGTPPAGSYLSPWKGAAGASYLCEANSIPMVKVGNSWTGQIDYVRPRFVYEHVDPTKRRDYPLSQGQMCITIPYASNAAFASELFRTAHNQAIDITIDRLNQYGEFATATMAQNFFREEVEELLKLWHPRAAVTWGGPCQGGVPRTEAKYGSACN